MPFILSQRFCVLHGSFLLPSVNFLNKFILPFGTAENRAVINTIFDELIAQNSGNSKLYFMHQKLSENCDFTQCKDKLEQLQTIVKSDINGDYKVLVMEEIMNFTNLHLK